MSHGAPYRPRRALASSDEGEGPEDHDWVDEPTSDEPNSTGEPETGSTAVDDEAAAAEGSVTDPGSSEPTGSAPDAGGRSPWSRPVGDEDHTGRPAASPATADDDDGPDDAEDVSDDAGTESTPDSGGSNAGADGRETWNGRGPTARRRRAGLLGVAAATLLAIVVAIGYAGFALTGNGRPAVVIGQDPPTSSAPTPTPTPPVSRDRLLTPEQATFLAPKSTWEVARTQTGRDPASPVATCLERPGADDTPAESTYLRTLTASGERSMAVLHEATAYADRDQAVAVFGQAARQLGGCTTEGAHLDGAATVESMANQALAVQVAVTPGGDPEEREFHTVLLIRTGRVLNIVDVATDDKFVTPQILAETMIPVINVQCTDAVGLCAQEPRTDAVVPPIGGEHPGLPVISDVPRLPDMTGHWAATDPVRDPKLPEGSSCERLGSPEVEPKATIARAYLVQDDANIPQTYGWDLVLFTMKDDKQAADFVSDVRKSIEDCEDRQRTAEVSKAEKFSGTGTRDTELTGLTWQIRQQTGADADTDYVDYRVALVQAGDKVVYLFLPLEKGIDFSDKQWEQLAVRAGQRATQIT